MNVKKKNIYKEVTCLNTHTHFMCNNNIFRPSCASKITYRKQNPVPYEIEAHTQTHTIHMWSYRNGSACYMFNQNRNVFMSTISVYKWCYSSFSISSIHFFQSHPLTNTHAHLFSECSSILLMKLIGNRMPYLKKSCSTQCK